MGGCYGIFISIGYVCVSWLYCLPAIRNRGGGHADDC